jgi:hypothetical protein
MADSEGRLTDLTEQEVAQLNAFINGALWERWQMTLDPVEYLCASEARPGDPLYRTLHHKRKAAAEALYYHQKVTDV